MRGLTLRNGKNTFVDLDVEFEGTRAFAIWDSEQQALFLVRDPLGIKPLYYADDGETLLAASQVKALLAAGITNTRPSPAGHVGFFLWGHVPEPYTLYREIRALPAGTTLWVKKGERPVGPTPYLTLPTTLREAEARFKPMGANEVERRFREVTRDSVEQHMLADVPVGVFLSSGLDSSAIGALAAEFSSTPLRTITLGFEEFRGAANDETTLAEAMAREFGFAHATRWVRRQEFVDEREKILAAMDQPTIDGVNTYFVSKAAKEVGLKVVLSGLGGDELLGGYSSFRDIPRLVGTVAPWTSRPYPPPCVAQVRRNTGVRRHVRRRVPSTTCSLHAMGITRDSRPGSCAGRLARVGNADSAGADDRRHLIASSPNFLVGNVLVHAQSTLAGRRLGEYGPFG